MRTIRFRGKRLLDNKFVYGSLVQCLDGSVGIFNGDDLEHYKILAIKKSTLGQFTGLYDKNGKAVYEGDIVRSTYSNEFVYEVVYEDKRFASFGLRRKQDAFMHYFGEAIEADECEVIGNVFDNHKLLKDEKD